MSTIYGYIYIYNGITQNDHETYQQYYYLFWTSSNGRIYWPLN